MACSDPEMPQHIFFIKYFISNEIFYRLIYYKSTKKYVQYILNAIWMNRTYIIQIFIIYWVAFTWQISRSHHSFGRCAVHLAWHWMATIQPWPESTLFFSMGLFEGQSIRDRPQYAGGPTKTFMYEFWANRKRRVAECCSKFPFYLAIL